MARVPYNSIRDYDTPRHWARRFKDHKRLRDAQLEAARVYRELPGSGDMWESCLRMARVAHRHAMTYLARLRAIRSHSALI